MSEDDELIERLRRVCDGTNEGDAATMRQAADRLSSVRREAIEEAERVAERIFRKYADRVRATKGESDFDGHACSISAEVRDAIRNLLQEDDK